MSADSHRFDGRGGEYRLVKEIGRGGMGSVWSGHRYQFDPSTKKEVVKAVAIKLLHPALALSHGDRERFFGEVQIAAQLEHGRIVNVIDIGTKDGSPFLVMEWVDGRDLSTLVKVVGRRLSFSIGLFIVGEVLAALEHVHERTIGGADAGVIHYDIKPANILISSAGEVKLADFGISRFAALSDGTLSRPIGTPRYMAPEQMLGRAQRESDIYSLGVVLHELLEGRRFLAEVEHPHEFHRLVASGFRPELSQPEIPPWVDGLRRQMLADRPEDRPRAADARQLILEKAAHYQLASRHLQALYAEFIGDASSGVTGVLDIETFGFSPELCPSPVPPLLPVAGELGSGDLAGPAEPTFAEHGAATDGAPILLRRADLQAPQTPGSPETARTKTVVLEPPLVEPPPVEPPLVEPPLVDWAVAESPAPAEDDRHEPTVLLESSFPDSGEVPHTTPIWRLEAPPRPLTGPASRPAVTQAREAQLRRNTPLWVFAGLVAVIIVLLVVLLFSLTRTNDEPRVAVFDDPPGEVPNEVEARNEIEVPSEVEARNEEVEVWNEEVEAPNQELEAWNEEVEVRNEEVEAPNQELEPAKAEKRRGPKPVEVVIVIDGLSPSAKLTAQVKIGRIERSFGGGVYIKLAPGDHKIRWRESPEQPWTLAGTLQVEALTNKYYDIRVKGRTLSVAVK